MNLANKNIIITAGGTCGHIYPALVVAELLKQEEANVTWVGTPNGMEANIVPKCFNIQFIKSSGIRKKGIIKKIIFPIKLIMSFIKARSILKKFKIDLVIGFGGYVSGPICLASVQRHIPIIIHEQNAKIGLTNRILAKLASQICLSFDIDNIQNYLTEQQLGKIKFVGNPVRKNIVALSNNVRNFYNPHINLLILGGSQGAKAINEIIPSLIIEAIRQNIDIKVWHQTGKRTFEKTKYDYSNIPLENIKDITAFIFDIQEAYQWADLIICRSGGLTVFECAIVGLPTIFIPLPSAVDDHQFFNTKKIVENNAGFCLRQDDMIKENLINIIKHLYNNRDELEKMSEIAKKTLIKDSSEQILICIKEILNNNQ